MSISARNEGAELVGATRLAPWLERTRERESFAATQPPAMLKNAA